MQNLITFFGRADLNNHRILTKDSVIYLDDVKDISDGDYLFGRAVFSRYGLIAIKVSKTAVTVPSSTVSLKGKISKILGRNRFLLTVTGFNNVSVEVECRGERIKKSKGHVLVQGTLGMDNCVIVKNVVDLDCKLKIDVLSILRNVYKIHYRWAVLVIWFCLSVAGFLGIILYNPVGAEYRVFTPPVISVNGAIADKNTDIALERVIYSENFTDKLISTYDNFIDLVIEPERPVFVTLDTHTSEIAVNNTVDNVVTVLTPANEVQEEIMIEVQENLVKTRTDRALELQAKKDAAEQLFSVLQDSNVSYMNYPYTEDDIIIMAKMLYGEAGGCSIEEQRLVIWCVFNRIDAVYYGSSVKEVVTSYLQFVGYREDNPIRADLVNLVKEEWNKWQAGEEAPICEPYARSSNYLYFNGDGVHNWFSEVFTDPIGW